MLHTVKVLVEMGLTQRETRAIVNGLLTTMDAYAKVVAPSEVYDALARDCMSGKVQTMDTPNGETIVSIQHGMSGADIKGVKADLRAFLKSDEFKGLPSRMPKAAKAEKTIVKADDMMTTLDDMTVREFRAHMTVNGGKFTLDRGVASVKMPGMRQTAYFGQDGKLLDMGDGSKDSRKAVLDREHAKGKLAYLSGLGKLTASQIDFVADCLIDDELAEYVTPKLKKIVEAKTAKALGN